jgi:hypothetical protein
MYARCRTGSSALPLACGEMNRCVGDPQPTRACSPNIRGHEPRGSWRDHDKLMPRHREHHSIRRAIVPFRIR